MWVAYNSFYLQNNNKLYYKMWQIHLFWVPNLKNVTICFCLSDVLMSMDYSFNGVFSKNIHIQKSVPVSKPHLHSKWSILSVLTTYGTLIVCIECVIFWYPIHTCYVWDQAVQQDFFMRWDTVHSLLKYFFKFQLWYWIQIYTTKYSNLLLIILILVWLVCSTYRKGEILMQKWHVTSQFVYCYMPY